MSGSVSYVFYAIDKPLTRAGRAEVSELSRRAQPTARRVDFWYDVDGYDLPVSHESLLAKYYDVMVRQDYGLWTLAMTWHYDEPLYKLLKPFHCDDQDMVGVRIEPINPHYALYTQRKRGKPTHLLAEISAFLSYDAIESIQGLRELPWDRAADELDDYDEEVYEDWYDEYDDNFEGKLVRLTNCLREDAIKGDVRAFYLAWKKFCGGAKGEIAPPSRLKQLPRYLKGFAKMLSAEPE